MKNSEVNNNYIHRDDKLKSILSIWYLKHRKFAYGRLMKHKSRLCEHGGMHKWGFNY